MSIRPAILRDGFFKESPILANGTVYYKGTAETVLVGLTIRVSNKGF